MGNTASFSQKIHISISTKFTDYDCILQKLNDHLNSKGIYVTKTNASSSKTEIHNTISNADIIIYCNSRNAPCVSQAIEYSYLIDNHKITYNLIINSYDDGFTEYIQGFLDNKCLILKDEDDIDRIVNIINKREIL